MQLHYVASIRAQARKERLKRMVDRLTLKRQVHAYFCITNKEIESLIEDAQEFSLVWGMIEKGKTFDILAVSMMTREY